MAEILAWKIPLMAHDKKFVVIVVAFIAIVVLAALLRVPRLDLRPVHGDEANQAVKTGILFEKGEYTYDPHEHHGPSLYYFALPVLWASTAESFADTEIGQYRIVTVFFGLLTILLLFPLRDVLGNWGMLWAALFMTVSHVMTYYSRYYIQEMLLVCFVQAVFTAGWRFYCSPRVGWAILLGVALGLVHATKETSALIAFCIVAATGLSMVYARIRDKELLSGQIRTLWESGTLLRLIMVCVAALTVSVMLFSSFFSNMRGPVDSLLTYTNYLSRAEGTGSTAMHDKPWYYYLILLTYTYRQVGPRWSEGLVLSLALMGVIAVLAPKINKQNTERNAAMFRRFLAFYTILILVLYSLIPYKTPWNVLVFYHGAALLAGIGAAAVVRAGNWRVLQAFLALMLLAGAAHMARQSYQGNYIFPADARNPYVYAHPSTVVHRLKARIDDIAAIADESTDMHINVIRLGGDYWPLPWYLRRYTKVGWWHRLPDRPDAALIIAAPELYDVLHERLQGEYFVEFYALRPDIPLHTYIRRDLWDAFMETRR